MYLIFLMYPISTEHASKYYYSKAELSIKTNSFTMTSLCPASSKNHLIF